MSDGTGFGGGTHDGRRVVSFAIDLPPGGSTTATLTARASEPVAATLEAVTTPTLTPPAAVAAVCGGS